MCLIAAWEIAKPHHDEFLSAVAHQAGVIRSAFYPHQPLRVTAKTADGKLATVKRAKLAANSFAMNILALNSFGLNILRETSAPSD